MHPSTGTGKLTVVIHTPRIRRGVETTALTSSVEKTTVAAIRIRPGLGRPRFGQPFDRSLEQGTPAALGRGVFTFSLDFELGVAAIDDRELYHHLRPRIAGTSAAVRDLLKLLERYNVSATWATVGHLFRDPGALDCEVDAWVEREMDREHLFAPALIEAIAACRVRQDIGCHTYRHINCAAAEYDDRVIDDELRVCGLLSERFGLKLRSFVFPFNRVGRLELLAKHGYTSFRGSNSEWYTRGPGGRSRWASRLRSTLKRLDDLAALPPPVDVPRRVPSGLWMIPHSMFYRGAGPDARWIGVGRQVAKAVRGLRRAVRRRGVFHLWTHPQNLGLGTAAALDGLEQIFKATDEYRRRGELDVVSMAELADRLNEHPSGVGKTC